ncbi:hypothetical protein Dtox_1531 [Desulfofarcimen acetoxidans DSM 771]|uniref:Uncharacterized protein n=1 Tax=Desulfofarcimen acetoxidans (strain ATCC 49208 / DSM 771 / KCTC 5769 / VKM B-1644 / 5575) TaxID=485916 RepID=C8VVT0_DESAS|nr:hypothetical protein [Desulfofarcimen acetoxidans]ACV62395.1 hypothetical protein Dtox_1531 [Desulfofarcimen acetoxidans DSM 771]
MLHGSSEKSKIQINDATVSFEDVYKAPNLSSELLEKIKTADILLLPYTDFKGYQNCLFPEQTYQFYTHLMNEAEKQSLSVDLAVSDEDYKEIELHADVVNIADILIQWVLFPIVTGMISAYLYDLVRQRKKKMNANVKITVEKNGKAKTVSFEGDIESFERAMKSLDETIFK